MRVKKKFSEWNEEVIQQYNTTLLKYEQIKISEWNGWVAAIFRLFFRWPKLVCILWRELAFAKENKTSVADAGRTVWKAPHVEVWTVKTEDYWKFWTWKPTGTHTARSMARAASGLRGSGQNKTSTSMQLALTNHSSFHEAVSLVAHLPEMINARWSFKMAGLSACRPSTELVRGDRLAALMEIIRTSEWGERRPTINELL